MTGYIYDKQYRAYWLPKGLGWCPTTKEAGEFTQQEFNDWARDMGPERKIEFHRKGDKDEKVVGQVHT